MVIFVFNKPLDFFWGAYGWEGGGGVNIIVAQYKQPLTRVY